MNQARECKSLFPECKWNLYICVCVCVCVWRKSLLLIKTAFIWVAYKAALKCSKTLILWNIITIITTIKWLFSLNRFQNVIYSCDQSKFSASLLQSSVSHGSSKIILICWFYAQEIWKNCNYSTSFTSIVCVYKLWYVLKETYWIYECIKMWFVLFLMTSALKLAWTIKSWLRM